MGPGLHLAGWGEGMGGDGQRDSLIRSWRRKWELWLSGQAGCGAEVTWEVLQDLCGFWFTYSFVEEVSISSPVLPFRPNSTSLNPAYL